MITGITEIFATRASRPTIFDYQPLDLELEIERETPRTEERRKRNDVALGHEEVRKRPEKEEPFTWPGHEHLRERHC